MSFLVIHRHRFPDAGSSASHGRIISSAIVDNLEGVPIRDAMRPMLRSGSYCIHIQEWIAIVDRIHTYTDGGVVKEFDDGTRLEVIEQGARQ